MCAARVVAIGGSAGGIEALLAVVGGLPRDLPACVLVTIHIGENSPSRLPEILGRRGPLPAAHARDGEVALPGRIYVAPPGVHLLVRSGRLRLSAGPTVNCHRPAIDAMFASAARWCGASTTAVILSGLLDDGAVGAVLIARAGGRVLVQDPDEAAFPSMPSAAWAAVPEAIPLAASDISPTLVELVHGLDVEREPTGPATEISDSPVSTELVEEVTDSMATSDDLQYLAPGESALTRLTCPECGGALAEVDLPHITFFRCHVGHQYGPRSLAAAQRESVEAKLWAAVAALEEHAVLARHLAETHQRTSGAHTEEPPIYYRTAATLARLLRDQVQGFSSPTTGTAEPDVPEM